MGGGKQNENKVQTSSGNIQTRMQFTYSNI